MKQVTLAISNLTTDTVLVQGGGLRIAKISKKFCQKFDIFCFLKSLCLLQFWSDFEIQGIKLHVMACTIHGD